MDDNNLPSLNVDTNSLPTPTRGRGVENHPLLRLSPPPLLPHINAHALIHTLHTFYLPLQLPPPHDPPYFCAFMNSRSIKKVRTGSIPELDEYLLMMWNGNLVNGIVHVFALINL